MRGLKVGRKVKIIGFSHSGAAPEMKKMLGSVYEIDEMRGPGCVIINDYFWDPRDICPIEKVEPNTFLFDKNHLDT